LEGAIKAGKAVYRKKWGTGEVWFERNRTEAG